MVAWLGFVMLLVAGGFGVEKDPKAPSAKEVLQFAPSEADYMVFADFRSVLPSGVAFAKKLQALQIVQENEELRRGMAEAMQGLEMGIGMVRSQTGIHAIQDLHWAASWVRYGADDMPQMLLAVSGSFPADVMQRLAGLANATPTSVGGRPMFQIPMLPFAVGQTRSNVLLAGWRPWVEERLAAGYRPSKVAGPLLKSAAQLLKAKPFLAVVSAPSHAMVSRIQSRMGGGGRGEKFLVGLLTGHEVMGAAMAHDSAQWTFTGRDDASFERARMSSEALLDLMRAFQHGGRGMLRLAYAWADDLMAVGDVDAEARQLISRHKDELYTLAMGFVGNGTFKSNVQADKKNRTVRVVAKGKKLSDVLPVGGLLPVLGGVLVWSGSDDKASYPMEQKGVPTATEPVPVPPPAR